VALADDLESPAPKDAPKPSMTYGADGGELVGRIPDGVETDPAFWRLVIADWGLDPNLTEIVPDSVQIRAWDMAVGNHQTIRARYYKARIRPRRAAMSDQDVTDLHQLVMRRRTRQTPTQSEHGAGFVVNLSDFQIGKGEGGGTPATVNRIIGAVDQARTRLVELRKLKRNITSVVIVGCGDLAEQCWGHYPSQQFTVDRTRREQLQIVRELITYCIDAFADLAPRIVVGAVPGNHGENRLNGKAATVVSDNDDLAVFDQVREALSQNPGRYSHVEWAISDDLVLTLDVEGVTVGWTHMHQGRGGERGITDWWKGQVMGNRPIASAQILNTAHFHHFLCSEATGRTLIQVPAMDGGSGWWTDKTGQSSPAGMVTYLAGSVCGARGWSDLQILEGAT
jgi:hypothetical protein